MTKPSPDWADDQIAEMLRRMGEGETLTSIAADPRMPSMATMVRWEGEQDEFGERITRARAMGYTARAEQIVAKVATCADPVKARLEFDAERWFLSHMAPKKFGNATTLKHADADGEKLQLDEVATVTRLAAITTKYQARLNAPDDAE